MEIKINREIRDYKENIFFGLSLRQLIFSLLACGMAVGIYLGLRGCAGDGNGQLAVHPRRSALCRYGLCEIPRHDGRKVFHCMAAVGISRSQAADLPTDQFVLGSYAGTAQAGKEALRYKFWCICPEAYSGTWNKKEA